MILAVLSKRSAAFVGVGLALGAGAVTLATSRVGAQGGPPPPAVPRWEQDCVEAIGVEEARAVARARGEAGWEIVAYEQGIMCFKRPLLPRLRDTLPGY
jgi:hypothetical protein